MNAVCQVDVHAQAVKQLLSGESHVIALKINCRATAISKGKLHPPDACLTALISCYAPALMFAQPHVTQLLCAPAGCIRLPHGSLQTPNPTKAFTAGSCAAARRAPAARACCPRPACRCPVSQEIRPLQATAPPRRSLRRQGQPHLPRPPTAPALQCCILLLLSNLIIRQLGTRTASMLPSWLYLAHKSPGKRVVNCADKFAGPNISDH